MDAPEQMQRLIMGYRQTQAVHVAAELGLSDLLAGKPVGVADLAAATGCDPRSLHRLLRALASIEVYRELPDGRYTSTPLGDQLRSDAAGNGRAQAVMVGRPYLWEPWSALLHNVRTGENAFTAVHGRGPWEYRADHPDESAVFDAAMTSVSDRAATAILEAYDFGRFATVVDVAGGRGALLTAILGRHPTMHGVLFDQPHVVAGAHLAGVKDRCDLVGGDVFSDVPAGGDAYVMKSILHDWEDPQAFAILRACRRVVPSSGALIVVERLLDAADQHVAFSDLNMMVGPGGLERTAGEYAELLGMAGFRLTRTVPTATEWVVIEAVPTA
jgi:hypothetical protein